MLVFQLEKTVHLRWPWKIWHSSVLFMDQLYFIHLMQLVQNVLLNSLPTPKVSASSDLHDLQQLKCIKMNIHLMLVRLISSKKAHQLLSLVVVSLFTTPWELRKCSKRKELQFLSSIHLQSNRWMPTLSKKLLNYLVVNCSLLRITTLMVVFTQRYLK
jgi:hypothetical protein